MDDLFKGYFGNSVKIQLIRESAPVKECRIAKSEDVYELVKEELKSADRETLLAINLSSSNKVLGVNIVSIGTLNASLAHPREVFKAAILQNAAGIILAHNHPSGNAEPSQDDLRTTMKLSEAGKILEIEVIDHVIVGNTFYSFLDNGKMNDGTRINLKKRKEVRK